MNNAFKQTILPVLSLFTSLGTLLCCALPALLVTLGMGAVMAGLISNAPWITGLSAHKPIIFTASGIMILLAGSMHWRARNAPCPIDPIKAKACGKLRKISIGILIFSAVIYMIGFFFAFLAKYFI